MSLFLLEWEERLVDYLWREWSIYAHSASIGLSVEHSNSSYTETSRIMGIQPCRVAIVPEAHTPQAPLPQQRQISRLSKLPHRLVIIRYSQSVCNYTPLSHGCIKASVADGRSLGSGFMR